MLPEEVKAHSDVAVVGSKPLYEDGTIQHAGVASRVNVPDALPYVSGSSGNAPFVSKRRRELQCVTAARMLIRRQVFAQVGDLTRLPERV